MRRAAWNWGKCGSDGGFLLLLMAIAAAACITKPSPWVPDVCHLEPCTDGDADALCWNCPEGINPCQEPGCACQPACQGRQCGPDGCGGLCGECSAPADWCDEHGLCACRSRCEVAVCGDDGCGGSCGLCSMPQEQCLEGGCVCIPDCEGRECGPDGCQGQCGSQQCPPGKMCEEGLCVPSGSCIPPSACPYDMEDVSELGYCVDSFEFTRDEFAEFLTNDAFSNECPGPEGLVPCFDPDAPGLHLVKKDGKKWAVGANYKLYPMTHVTWYGAVAACASQCKVLCPWGIWYQVCSTNDHYPYPYGPEFEKMACCGSGAGNRPPTPAETGEFANCRGGYDLDLFDLSGNVWEWADGCQYGSCMQAGGGYMSSASELACSSFRPSPPLETRPDVGFRCCLPLSK